LKNEIMVWGWELLSTAWLGVPQKVREMSWNFTLPGEWSLVTLMSAMD